MFELDPDLNYRVPQWKRYPWLLHGFGTKDSTPPAALATVKQIHSSQVLLADRAGSQGTADGLVSHTPGLLVGVKTADCLPILLLDPVLRVVSAVHAGWRGSAQRILAGAIRLMTDRLGVQFHNLEVAIGPGIGLCCFEVGPEVAREFGPWPSVGKTYLDLARINAEQLQEEGVKTIYQAGLCTFCEGRFYSFRKDRENAGRMISYVGINR